MELAFINQSAQDIRRKLQKLERVWEKSLRDLVGMVEKAYRNRHIKDEKKIKTGKILNRDLARVLLGNGNPDQRERKHQVWNIAEVREPREGHQPEPGEDSNQPQVRTNVLIIRRKDTGSENAQRKAPKTRLWSPRKRKTEGVRAWTTAPSPG